MQFWIIAAAGFAALALAPAATSNDMLRGQWQQDTRFRVDSFDGKAPPAAMGAVKASSDRSCYDAAETRSIADFLRAGMERQCPGLRIGAAGGNLSVSGTCRFGNAAMTTTGSGSYSSTDFDLTIHGTGVANGHRVTITSRDTGHWLGTCPA